MIKLIVTDLDGTLAPEASRTINPEYFDVIRALTEKGVHFTVASGRHSGSVKKVFAPVLDCISIISQNGNVIEFNGKSKVLDPIPMDWVQEFWQDLSQFEPAEGVLDTAITTFCPFEGSQMHHVLLDEYQYDTKALGGWGPVPENDYSMMTIYHPVPGMAEKLNNEYFCPKWEERLNLVCSGATWVDCIMKSCSKGNALKELCSILDIDIQDTIAFGDNMNDMSMIKAAGKGYAVSSGREEVKAAADAVIPSYTENGVLQELKKILADIK